MGKKCKKNSRGEIIQNKKTVKFDLDGYEVVKDAILEIINQSPLIPEKEKAPKPLSFEAYCG